MKKNNFQPFKKDKTHPAVLLLILYLSHKYHTGSNGLPLKLNL